HPFLHSRQGTNRQLQGGGGSANGEQQRSDGIPRRLVNQAGRPEHEPESDQRRSQTQCEDNRTVCGLFPRPGLSSSTRPAPNNHGKGTAQPEEHRADDVPEPIEERRGRKHPSETYYRRDHTYPNANRTELAHDVIHFKQNVIYTLHSYRSMSTIFYIGLYP